MRLRNSQVNRCKGPVTDEPLVHPASLPSTTTLQQDLTFAGQRKVNLIWEYTQSGIAITVVFFTMIAGVYAMIYSKDIPSIISVAFGMVTGFYFSRTNHAAIGGVGKKPEPLIYQGR